MANFPMQILSDGVHLWVHLLCVAIQLVPGWVARSVISDSLISGTRVINGVDHGANYSGEL